MAIPSTKSYVNEITVDEVSLALEHLLVAPEGTAWTPGKIDISTPPTGFIHLGAIQEDSPQLSVQKDYYRLATGVPAILQYQAVLGVAGEFQAVMLSNRNSRAFFSMGGIRMYHVANTPSGGWAYVHSVYGRDHVVVNSVAMTAAITPGNLVVTDTSTAITTTLNEAFVTSIAAVTGNTLFDVYLRLPDGFPTLPVQSHAFYAVAHDRYAMGSSQLPFFHVLGVADMLNGGQIIHQFRKATPRGQFVEALRAGQDIRVPVLLDLFGYAVSTPYVSSGSELIVAERFWFPPTSPGQ